MRTSLQAIALLLATLGVAAISFVRIGNTQSHSPVIRLWPSTTKWWVALQTQDFGPSPICTMATEDKSKADPIGMDVAANGRTFSIMAMERTADPTADPELRVSIDTHEFGSFTVDGTVPDPNVKAAILATIPTDKVRSLLSAMSRGQRVSIDSRTFSMSFDLHGADLAINQLFECADFLGDRRS